MQRSARVVLRQWSLSSSAVALVLALAASRLGAEVATLKSGQQIEGRIGRISSMGETPESADVGGGGVKVSKIAMMDDGLRRSFFPTFQISGAITGDAGPIEKIAINQRVAGAERRVGGVGTIIKITPFDEWGRRVFTMSTPKGPVDVIQGITEITPIYTKVEGLAAGPAFSWDMRVATSSIPRKTLSAVIRKNIDPKNADQRFKIVRLYIQSERFKDAQEEVEGMLKDFPDLTELTKQVKALHHANINRILKEIASRRDAGQHELAFNLLSNFPAEGVAGETLIRVRDELADYNKLLEERKKIVGLYAQQHKALDADKVDEKVQARVALVGQEIDAELNIHTLPRFADYLRLSDDEKMRNDQKLALAISGWLLGNDSGTENLAVALNLFDVRNLVRAYLNAKDEPARKKILDQLRSLEGSDPTYLSKIVAHMKPAIDTPPSEDEPIFGYFELTVPGLAGEADVEYCVQLPPEYDPYRRYPCVVTMGGGRHLAPVSA